jgi:hypothetical protein
VKQSVFCGFLGWAVSAGRQEPPKSLVIDTVHQMITPEPDPSALSLLAASSGGQRVSQAPKPASGESARGVLR